MAQTKNPAVIKSNRLFSGIYDISFNFKEKNYVDMKEGEVIYSRGDKSEYMYLLINGRVKFKTYENPRQPKVFLVSKNDFFGEKELIDKLPRNSSAVAEKDSTLFRISYKDFVKISHSNRKVLDNLKEQKYEEVVAPSRKTEIKEDIFKRILNEAEVPVRKETGIELKDYSAENPLLEMKARDEINEESKIFSDDEDNGLILTDQDIIIDDDGVTWEFDDSTGKQELEIPDIEDKELPEIEEEEDTVELPADVFSEDKIEEPPLAKEPEQEEDIVDSFLKIQEKVNEFRESLEQGQDKFEEPEPVEPFVLKPAIPDSAIFSALEKLSSGLEKDETDRLIVEACTELVNAEKGLLYFPDENNLLTGKLYEEDTELTAGPDTIPVRCFNQSQLINIKDVFNDSDFNPDIDYISYFHVHSLICLPVMDGDKVKAVLQLFNSRNGEFSDNDELMLRNITPVILRSIERYERFEKSVELKENEISELMRRQEEIPVQTSEINEEEQYPEVSLRSVKEEGELPEEPEKQITDVFLEEEKKTEEKLQKKEKQISLKVISEFLLQEFQAIIRDIRQFNAYLQRIDIPGETKEISDIVTDQTVKIIDLIEALKAYSESRKIISEEKQSYITIFDNLINLLAEYTEGRKVNLYKRFEKDSHISADPKFLYLAVFQIIKYQCDLMPFGGNIFISSAVTDDSVEVLIRNATNKTDETLVITAPMEYTEETPAGLGLSLARRIIEDHNALLEVKNQSGTGIEVGIRFPLA